MTHQGGDANGQSRVYLVTQHTHRQAGTGGAERDAEGAFLLKPQEPQAEEMVRVLAGLPLAEIISRLEAVDFNGNETFPGKQGMTPAKCHQSVDHGRNETLEPPPVMPAPEDARPSGRRLTARQIEILMALRDGATNKEIGRTLGILEATVKAHLKSAYRRLQVKNRTQAALVAPHHVAMAAESQPSTRDFPSPPT